MVISVQKQVGMVVGLLFASASSQAMAQANAQPAPQTEGVGIGEIIVTAQKRQESSQKVGISITALSGEDLVARGVASAADLGKAVPGFNYVEAARGGPVYFLRGMGFDDSSLTSVPAVATYLDEVPMSNPNMTRNVMFDIERVEALKGPQGILFGQNSTGGAVNFIANKPGSTTSAGMSVSYGRFNSFDGRAYLSVPVTENLGVRISGMVNHSGPWQKSYTRNDKLGKKRVISGRAIVDWEPSSDLHLTFTLQGWLDKSDTQAGQLLEVAPSIKATIPPAYDSYPRAPRNARAADWDADPINNCIKCVRHEPFRRDDSFVQPSLRVEYDIAEGIRFTSLTSYAKYKQFYNMDTDASDLNALSLLSEGSIKSFNQEIRLSGATDRLNWVIGANYTDERTSDNFFMFVPDASTPGGFFGLFQVQTRTQQKAKNKAVFGNVAWEVIDNLKINAGIRYTKDKRVSEICNYDVGDGSTANAYNTLFSLLNPGNTIIIPAGGCIISNNLTPIYPDVVHRNLSQDNVSWRLGLDWQATPDVLGYVNVTRGFKSGAITSVNAADASQIGTVPQEKVTSYEVGIKSTLLDRKLRLNAAVFYNDYRGKQLRGRILDPFGNFGVLETLVSIPKSEVYGAEVDLSAMPIQGLTLSFNATYVKSKVLGSTPGYDPVLNLIDFKGMSFPHTPRWHLVGSAGYEFPTAHNLTGFVNANVQYRSSTMGLFNDPAITGATRPSPVLRPNDFFDPEIFKINGYATVDANIGVRSDSGGWEVSLWANNLFNKYYQTNITQNLDNIYSLAGKPRTFGISASFKY